MPTQKEIWREEHLNQETFTRIHSDKPSFPIPLFADHVATEFFWKPTIRIVDMGCGKGRNSIYLAKRNFEVLGVDFSEEAICQAKNKSEGLPVSFEVLDLTAKWPGTDEAADAVIDCNTTICIPNPGREIAISEARRVLRQGGLYLFYGVAKTDFVDASLGPEPNSAIFPRTGKFEKQYTKKELLEAYKDFELVSLKEAPGSDIIEGKETEYLMWIAVFKKTK